MNKLKSILLTLLLTFSFAACAQQPTDADSSSEPAKSSQESSSVQEESEQSEDEVENENNSEKVYVADAAMFRGAIVSVEDSEDGKLITLEQAEGTDFGAPKLKFQFTEDTTCSFEESKLTDGAYLEVFYGLAEGQSIDPEQTYSAIGANIYAEAEMVNFNGTLKEYKPSEDNENEGSLMMEDLKTGEEVIFHYAEETNFYLDIDQLKQGDQLNIFHSGAYTRSLPPQGSALEVRNYKK